MGLTYNDFLRQIDIQDVLIDAGYTLNRKDGIRYPSYVRTDNRGYKIKGDKFIVMPSRQLCFQPPVQKTYNVISFIKEHPNMFTDYRDGMNLNYLVNLVCNRLLNHPIDRTTHPIITSSIKTKDFNIKDYELLNFQKHNFDNIKQFYPYFRNRHIDINTQKAFGQHFYLATLHKENGMSFKNLSFPLRIPGQSKSEADGLKDIVGFEERGRARLDGSSGYKGKALGSNSSEGLWIASPNNIELKNAQKVLWFESAYDALSYYQLNSVKDNSLDNAVFLSTGGNPTVMQFRGVISEAKQATHHLCFDNDLAGNQFVENFKIAFDDINSNNQHISSQLLEYMQSLSNPKNYLSGEPELLPDDLRKAYASYETEEIEWHSMKQSGLVHPDDLKDQADKAIKLYEEYKMKLTTALSAISEHPTFVREIPEEGCKDWNDLLIKQSIAKSSEEKDSQSITEGVDISSDGIVTANECDQRKTFNFNR